MTGKILGGCSATYAYRYGQYARFCLAEKRAVPLPEPWPEGWSEGECYRYPIEESARRYAELVADATDFPLADVCMLKLAKVYSSLGKKVESVSVLGELLADFPDRSNVPVDFSPRPTSTST